LPKTEVVDGQSNGDRCSDCLSKVALCRRNQSFPSRHSFDRDEADATKDALMNVVRQAVGTFVSAETLMKSDQVVRDSILPLSDGFVQEYEPVGKPRDNNGLIDLTSRAQVRRRALMEREGGAHQRFRR
jgi:hypothetical protein